MLIIAHRGASFDAPENTLAAVRLAWRQRADAVEVDVHLSRDGQLVVIHDATTRRTTGVRRRVSASTLVQLRALDAGSWKAPRWRGEKIPVLEQVLATVPPGKRIFIEIKSRKSAAPALARAFARSRCRPEQIVLIGFSLRALQSLKRAFPQIEVCWIAELKRHPLTRRWPAAQTLIQKARAARLDGLDLCANEALSAGLIKKIQSAGLNLYVWTVDTKAKAQALARLGVTGLTTNRPAYLREELGLRLGNFKF